MAGAGDHNMRGIAATVDRTRDAGLVELRVERTAEHLKDELGRLGSEGKHA